MISNNNQPTDQQWEIHARNLQSFMNTQQSVSKIHEMINNEKQRFQVDLDKIREIDPNLANAVIKEPVRALKILKQTLNLIVEDYKGVNNDNNKKNQKNVSTQETNYHISFEGNIGRNLITPRGLNSNMINNLVAVQGIVTRQSIVRQRLQRSVHYCEKTDKGIVREYNNDNDLTKERNLNALQAFPLKDQDGNPLQTEQGFCQYTDFQTILLQEMPEKAPTGMLPRSVELIVEDDLVDKVKPGDRIQAVGVYIAKNDSKSILTGVFHCNLICLNIQLITTELEQPQVSVEDIKNIKLLAEKQDVLKILSQSIAPSIYGHDEIKFAILLMLLGGHEKTLENGTHLRGDINILIIGDPSTAKSQLLRRVLTIAPLVINTTGRGTSGVGLTAAVIYDRDSGDRYLAAGAMVLADRGVVCIDEFDKMSEEDRVAIHEVMEQQTVTIAKAGIHTSLNARCSVIAAANPIYGEYQQDLAPTKNIGLPDSLLSRFDLLFVVIDFKDAEMDKFVAERVVKNHQYISKNQKEQSFLNFDEDFVLEPEYINNQQDNQVYEKSYQNTQGDQKLVTQNFLKKYIYYAKKQFQPQLTEEATNYISNIWSELRQKVLKDEQNSQGQRTLPITIRTLETLIRLSTAHAKLRLSKNVTISDACFAEKLLKFALFQEKFQLAEELMEIESPVQKSGRKPKKQSIIKQKKEEYIHEESPPIERQPKKQTRSKKQPDLSSIKDESQNKSVERTIERMQVIQLPPSSEQQRKFVFKMICELTKKNNAQQLNFDQLLNHIKLADKEIPGYVDDEQMIRKTLQDLAEYNKLQIEADQIYPF